MASMILSLKSVADPNYSASNYQIFLLSIAIMIIQSIISSMPTNWLAQFNAFGTFLNTVALFVAIIVILAANDRSAPKFNSSSEVWGTITNQNDFPNGVTILMSFISIIWTMSGYDAPFHLSEECSNANIASPRAIVMTSSLGGLLGWALQMTIAYTVVNLDDVFNADLGQPLVTYLSQVLSTKLVYFITTLTIISSFFMGQASMVAASRVAYAYSRDGCFPLHRIWATVNKRTDTPVNAVWFNTTIGCLLLLLIFAGDIAIGAIFSVGAISSYIAFTIPIGMKVFFSNERFKPGPWNLGRWSRPIGYLSVAYVALMVPILCLPSLTGLDLDAAGMNWTVLVYFGPMLFALIWYFAYARTFFTGPKIDIQDMIYTDEQFDGVEQVESLPESQEKSA